MGRASLVHVVVACVLALGACAHEDQVSTRKPDAATGGGQIDAGGQSGDCATPCSQPDECCEIGGRSFCINTAGGDMNNCGGCGLTCEMDTADRCTGAQCMCGFERACGGEQQCCTNGPQAKCA